MVSPTLTSRSTFSAAALSLATLSLACAPPPPKPVEAPVEVPRDLAAEARARENAPVPELDLGPEDLTRNAGTPELSLAGELVRQRHFHAAAEVAEKAIVKLGVTAPIDVRLAAYTLAARARREAGDRRTAGDHRAAAETLWKQAPGAIKVILGEGGSDEKVKERLARAILAEAETLYFSGEELRLYAESHHRPEYAGKPWRAEVNHHLKVEIPAWIETREKRMADAEAEYARIGALPKVPRGWLVAADERAGAMWIHYHAELATPPVPEPLRGKGVIPNIDGTRFEELRKVYEDRLAELRAPKLGLALDRYKKCSEDAGRLAVETEEALTCAKVLRDYAGAPGPKP